MIISIDAAKSLDKNSHPFMIKTQQNWYRGHIGQQKKAIYDKPTANIILCGEKLKAFSPKSGTRQ